MKKIGIRLYMSAGQKKMENLILTSLFFVIKYVLYRTVLYRIVLEQTVLGEDGMVKREERIGFEIRKLDHMLERNIQAHVRAAGIDEVTLMHGWIIRYLYMNRERDVFQRDIEQYFSIGRSTVTNIIQLMEKKGFILRESVEHDARLKKVVLTKKGIRNHEMIENLIEKLDASLVEGITDEELAVFYSVDRKSVV